MEHFTQLLSWAQQSPLQATFYGLVLAYAVKKLLFTNDIPAVKKIAPPIKNPKVLLSQFFVSLPWPKNANSRNAGKPQFS
jgi:hypothetical protein